MVNIYKIFLILMALSSNVSFGATMSDLVEIFLNPEIKASRSKYGAQAGDLLKNCIDRVVIEDVCLLDRIETKQKNEPEVTNLDVLFVVLPKCKHLQSLSVFADDLFKMNSDQAFWLRWALCNCLELEVVLLGFSGFFVDSSKEMIMNFGAGIARILNLKILILKNLKHEEFDCELFKTFIEIVSRSRTLEMLRLPSFVLENPALVAKLRKNKFLPKTGKACVPKRKNSKYLMDVVDFYR
jgi:hypothetical protein